MPRLVKKRSKKTGLPPGTPVHIGEKKSEKTRITVVEYDQQNFREREFEIPQGDSLFPKEPSITWINVDGIHQAEIMEKLGSSLGLHPLVQEDILNSDQRPKIEDYGEDLFIVLKMLTYEEQSDELQAAQVSLVLRSHAVLSFQEKEGRLFDPVKERLRNGRGRLRRMGADYLAYSLLDIIVDHYFGVLEKMGERIETLEERLVINPTTSTLVKLQNLKREMIFLRKWIWPLREVINRLERGEFFGIQETTRIYLRDVYDHTIQVIETIETFRDMLSGMMDIYLSSLNNRMNAVMKVLTIIATIFMPLSFLTGVFGMNFKDMPGLEWRWGYLFFWVLIVFISGCMLLIFRRRKWL